MKVDAGNVIKRLTLAGIISTVSLSILMQDFETVFTVMCWYLCTILLQEEIIDTYRSHKARKRRRRNKSKERAA